MSAYTATDEPPLRAELFSVAQLERHARTMAGWHEVSTKRGRPDGLMARLDDNGAFLREAYALITQAVVRGRQITPAAEWFIDNHQLIEEQIRTTRRHLPRQYHRELPRLANAPVPGTPRVYELALELISHAHGRVDDAGLRAFIASYQTVKPLKLGELWAIPIMLRLALIENLRRVVGAVTAGRRDRERAATWVAKMMEVAAEEPTRVVVVLAQLVAEDPPLSDSFVAELSGRLQGQGQAVSFPMTWLEQRLGEQGRSIEQVLEQVTQSQAADQVAISNSIGSLRFLNATDWHEFVEAMSVVERELRRDPSYGAMDFATRDRYRHVVERIARAREQPEQDVAAAAIDLAARSEGRAAHVGYYLIDDGLPQFAQGRRVRTGPRHATYIGAIVLLTALFTWLLGASTRLELAWWPLLAIGGNQLAIALVHWASTLLVAPHVLPRLDFAKGIPSEHRTLVAVPTMLTDDAEVDALVEALEVRFLANRDPHLGFALVTDFRDAASERMPGDDLLLARARDAIAQLNRRYPDTGGFFLFHRARRWNPREGVWMGWERKRGKLEELNEALRGDRARFATIEGPLERLDRVAYVIVLDSDTMLPSEAGRALASTLAHPLNRPIFDPGCGRVVAGYSILQPRVAVSMASTTRSRFGRLFGGEPGIDPYTRAVSDVYQDLFGEGSFVGKGIYDVDAFRAACGKRFPENCVLSHDLLEGAYARAGLVSDVLLVEDYPATHGGDVARRSRWTRGDWQLLGWLRRRVPDASGRVRNPISRLSQWKILDNLRRSIVPIALVATLIAGWLRGAALMTTVAVAAIAIVPGLLAALAALGRRPKELPAGRHRREVARGAVRQLGRDVFALACLPAEALWSLEAIGRALVRVLVTRRRMLEWRTARDAHRAAGTGPRALWIGPLLAIAAGVLLREDAIPAAPMLVAWTVAPLWSWWLGRPIAPKRHQLAADDLRFLRTVARRTWRFFEEFVGPADHDLPPDNFQEDPPRGLAHRTSPTNIGLSLTANLAAHDFGYVTTGELIARTTRTFASLDRMERYRGHFYNWYDTTTLEPLLPRYVSTVDSGNLAGHLLILAAGLEELIGTSGVSPRIFTGLGETLTVLEEELGSPRDLTAARDLLRVPPTTPAAIDERLALLDVAAQAILVAVERKGDARPIGWARAFAAQVRQARDELGAPDRGDALRALAARCRAFAELDYEFLYDRTRHLLAIGYHVADHRLDASAYDLLASEARLASYVAIAQGKLPPEHWFRLGRSLTSLGGQTALLSWSGSMFEYLMPLLVMPSYDGTLLSETHEAVVARQIAYGEERHVPWGFSESGYYKTDAQLNYQYRAFGVPGLGFKRGLGDDLVVAPYASALALMVAPEEATANLRRLATHGELGDDGFYEAIDFTVSRLPSGKASITIRSYMAHHQGMAFLSLAYVLLDRPMQRRFLATPMFRAAELLLQERIPMATTIEPHPPELSRTMNAKAEGEDDLRVFTTPSTPAPEVHLLSNGRYHVMVTNAGGGYSRWRDLAVTRWREDATRDAWGTFAYLRDVDTGAFWSAAHQPTLVRGPRYEAIFSAGRAEFRRADRELETHVEIAVSPEDDIELRRITLTNRGKTARTIELTTYAEVVLSQAAADLAHPAFSNLFVQTELIRDEHAILCTRRPRSGEEKPPWMIHALRFAGADDVSYETSRAAFLGRGRTTVDPIALHTARLGDSEGSVLDPIVAIRGQVTLAPEQTVKLHVVTGVAETRIEALALIEKYRDDHAADRLLELSWTHSHIVQRRLDVSASEAQLYERLAGHVIFSSATMRAPRTMIARNRGTQAGLWAYGISGDLPIVLVRIADAANLELVRQLLKAHTYWRTRGLACDLVIWNEDPSGYRQVLQEEIQSLLAGLGDPGLVDKPAGVFVRRTEQISAEDRVMMQTVARLIVTDSAGTLAEQMERRPQAELPGLLLPNAERGALQRAPSPVTTNERPDLVAFNGLGGFTSDGKEYVITTRRDAGTPAPWSNVLANPWFGSVVTESGAAYTWCENAHSYRLTPWHNDAVSDASGEACYLRDEETGQVWSPTPLPVPAVAPYVSRHGFGYSVFETTEHGISSELTTYVATDAPVKFVVVKLRNRSGKPRKLSLTSYYELVLGANRAANAPHVVTELDARSGGLLARNPYDSEFGARVAFLDCSESTRAVTGDRQEFLGRNGTLADPAALGRVKLSNRVGAAFDPCMAMQTVIELADGQEKEVAFAFGSGRDLADARQLVTRFRGTGAARAALEEVWRRWTHTLGAVHVATPDPTLNFLANGWLIYQVLSARLWGRSGFYQSGGAFGFRDQLQDAMALVHAAPALLREQILRAGARQFPEGDVQHWWHPTQGRGVRTHISDDYLWLPYAVCRYVSAVGDTGVLDEKLQFLEGRRVNQDEDSYYDLPVRSEESGTLYEHCVRAIRHGLRFGVHGLPLMGSGDWNDGMNLVGAHGQGESVWLAFFLHDVLAEFGALARRRGDEAFAAQCVTEATRLRDAIETHGWDGGWYRRAYFDDGTPLGSSSSPECQIDSLPQSWAVLSGAGDPERAKLGLAALDARLVRRDLGVVQLFDPPFDHSALRPGYVKGYVPGVRENGGQYTHAAIWAAMAFAEAGEHDKAWELFEMLDPARHGDTAEAIARYKVEPYVVAADVYTNPQHAGRGGWTWYTGSAAWMYRLIAESLLGLHLEVDRLRVAPRMPAAWPGFDVHYRHRETSYRIHVINAGGGHTVRRVTVDGAVQADRSIPLVDDRGDHQVEVEIGG